MHNADYNMNSVEVVKATIMAAKRQKSLLKMQGKHKKYQKWVDWKEPGKYHKWNNFEFRNIFLKK